MRRLYFSILVVSTFFYPFSSLYSQWVGIGTATPKVRLHGMDSPVLFTGGWSMTGTPDPSSVTLVGKWMMWYPDNKAFEAGRSGEDTWEKVNNGSAKKIDVNGWAHCSGINWYNASDKILKKKFKDINGEEILKKIVQMEINQWNYNADDEMIKHVGPLAQDFYTFFELGNDDVTISTVDTAGVTLAAIKELNRENAELRQIVEAFQQ